MKKTSTNLLVRFLLHLMAALFTYRPSLNRYLKSDRGWINWSIGIRTKNRTVECALIFKEGRVKVSPNIPDDADTILEFTGDEVVREMLRIPPNEVLNLVLKNRMRTQGNLVYPNLFNFYISLLMGGKHRKMIEKKKVADKRELTAGAAQIEDLSGGLSKRAKQLMKGDKVDPGVKFLNDPYLSQYTIDDFPRLKTFLDIHFTTTPEICHERPKLLTDWFKANGFETKKDKSPWVPELRQAHAYKHLMENRSPVIRQNDLIAGTTTAKEIGVVIYPDAHGTMIWGELNSTDCRALNPYEISEETRRILHHEIFPYWANRNFREWVRTAHNNPLCQQLDERFAVYFLWKTVALSHTIADFPKLLRLGTKGMIREIESGLAAADTTDSDKNNLGRAMIACLEGLTSYAKNLSGQAKQDAQQENDPKRKMELENLAAICKKVPENPAETLDEAINALWIGWVGLHMENTNAGLSLGRMDQWLQPFFKADLMRCTSDEEKKACIKHSLELIGCFYMRCTDHLPLIPDIGNYLFGGSSSDQAITLGGVTPDGEDGVNDMTYIFLKVTEMLSIRDPNVNARFHKEKNSTTYLTRLCEVNLITAATPSLHNDETVMASLEEFNYDIRDLRDWAATGCVEPTLSGKHMGHTNCMMMNMVAALEMALNNGQHPLMNWRVGPETGSIEKGDFKTFDAFYDAFITQYKFLIDQSIAYNNMLGDAHGYIRPTPFLSSLIDDTLATGKDVTKGGARYNSSGAACIGLADVTDSMMVIRSLVFDKKSISFTDLKAAVDDNFESDPVIRTLATKKVPLFGSGSDEAVAMANKIAKFTHDHYGSHENYRGGRYTAGFWSMSNHVAFGNLSGALPSGRLSGKAFTPGLTPQPIASKNLLDNIRDVAKLDPKNLNNNIAFNVKVVPSANDTHEKTVDNMFSYVKTYFNLGGMQMQMNVVTSAMLKDAMVHPENYRNLIVRISGYNAYFVTLNKDLQTELIERAEYGI